MTVYLNLSELRPLDILLTRGTSKFSTLITLASSLKTRKRSDYSHAALVLAPSVTVEALADEGIVCGNLTAPLPNPHARQGAEVPDADPFSPVWTDGRLQVLVRLDGVDGACVLRSRTPPSTSSRTSALSNLVTYYLRQYSEIGRLTQPILRLPDWLEDLIKRAARPLDGSKEDPAVFCSELVCLLMATTFGVKGAAPNRVTPSDLGHATNCLVNVEAAIYDTSSGQPLPTPVSDTLKNQLRAWLSFPSPGENVLKSKILRILHHIPPVHADLDPSQSRNDLSLRYGERQNELRKEWVDTLQQQLTRHVDPVWTWIQGANECRRTCPSKRREWANNQQVDEQTKAKLAAPQSAFGSFFSSYEHRLRDANRRCDTITSCTEALRTFSALKRGHEAYMQQLSRQIAARNTAESL